MELEAIDRFARTAEHFERILLAGLSQEVAEALGDLGEAADGFLWHGGDIDRPGTQMGSQPSIRWTDHGSGKPTISTTWGACSPIRRVYGAG